MINDHIFQMELTLKLEEIKMQQKIELNDKFVELLGIMSGFNAAEGAWSREAEARGEHKQKLYSHTAEMLEAGFTQTELKEISHGSLTSESDYLPLQTRIALKEAK